MHLSALPKKAIKKEAKLSFQEKMPFGSSGSSSSKLEAGALASSHYSNNSASSVAALSSKRRLSSASQADVAAIGLKSVSASRSSSQVSTSGNKSKNHVIVPVEYWISSRGVWTESAQLSVSKTKLYIDIRHVDNRINTTKVPRCF